MSISTKSTDTAPLNTITSDASLTGWGAVRSGKTVRFRPLAEVRIARTHQLELQAAFLDLRALASRERSTPIRMEMDNKTSVAYVNR